MKRLLVLLLILLLPLSAFALHAVSDDYALQVKAGDQPSSFTVQCGTSAATSWPPLVDTAGTNGTVPIKGGVYLSADLTQVTGASSGASCTVFAVNSSGQQSTSVPFAIPVVPNPPANVRVTP